MKIGIFISLIFILLGFGALQVQPAKAKGVFAGQGEGLSKQSGAPDNPTGKNPEHIVIDNLSGFSPVKDVWDKTAILLTGLLVLVGFLTLAAIWHQATIAANAAESARQSVDAIVAENRPWLILSKQTKVPTAPPDDWKFPVVITNFGKSPARIISLQVAALLGQSSGNPPDTSIYNQIEHFQPFLLPQGESLEWQKRLPQPWASDDVVAGKQFLWLCGLVRYFDVFERTDSVHHETAFCLVYRLPSGMAKGAWQRSGPPDYNRAT